MKKSFYTLGLLFIVCFISNAQEGEYDLSFANVGYKFIKSADLTTPQTGYAIAVQPDGKIVTAGPGRGLFNNGPVFMITRQLTNGQLDPGFGNGGIVFIDPETSGEDGIGTAAYGVAIAADGKIIVAGGVANWHDFSPTTYGTTIVRLNTNGSPDNSFSGDGVLILKLSVPNVFEAAWDVALQNDGKIVISGLAHDGVKPVMAVARINTDATLDNSFNGTGLLYINFPFAAQGLGVKIQPDGKILSVGKAMNAAGNYDYALVRLNANGSYDNSFDGDGKWTRDFAGGMDEATDVDILTNGKLIISGTTSMPTLTPTLVRLNADGSYDNSFDGDGVRPIFIAPGNTGQSVIAQTDGRTIWLITTSTVYFLVKLNSDGSPYAPFSFDGVGIYSYSGMGDAYDIALQADGKIVTSGFGANGLASPTSPEYPNIGRAVSRILNSSGTPLITITCPASLTVNTGINAVDNCIGLAPGLFAELNLETPYTFITTGATVSSGSQSAGPYFNRGVTTVTYTSVIDPSKSCSFTVTVVDAKPPVLNCINEVSLCRTSNNTYTIPQLTASDNCGIQSTQFSIAGATSRNGSGTNASGLFNPGASTITWTVTDISGNSSTCQTVVNISSVSASIADQYAVSPGGEANKIYIGYGPQSLQYSIQVSGGVPPYTYSWSNGGSTSTSSFTAASTGLYNLSVTVTDSRGCSTTVSKPVEVVDIRCGNKGNNITVCKPNGKDKSLCLPVNAVQAQLKNGGYLGDCLPVAFRGEVPAHLKNATIHLQANVSPNPSASSFVLSIKSDDKDTPVHLRVVDIMGREVQLLTVAPNTVTNIGESLKTGVYLLQVRQGNQKPIIQKIVKIH